MLDDITMENEEHSCVVSRKEVMGGHCGNGVKQLYRRMHQLGE